MPAFVVFEGIDGSGKSTAVAEIQRRLEAKGVKSTALREPTEKTDASREIRRILRTVTDINEQTSRDLLDLFLIDRLWDIRTQIQPALAQGHTVLLDRYYLSTAAYQAADAAATRQIMDFYLNDARILQPSAVVFIDLPVGICLQRLESRGKPDAFESKTRLEATQARYRDAFSVFKAAKAEIPVTEFTRELTAADFDALAEQVAGGL